MFTSGIKTNIPLVRTLVRTLSMFRCNKQVPAQQNMQGQSIVSGSCIGREEFRASIVELPQHF